MSKKLLPNRSSKTVAPDALSKVRQAIQLIMEVLGDDTDISDADYKGLRKIADKLKRECDDVFEIAKENGNFVEAPLSIEEMQKDKEYYELCDSIRALLKSLIIRLDREQNIAGAEYYNACSVFEDDVDAKVNKGSNPKAQNVQAQLAAIERNRGSGNTKKDNKDGKSAS
jgi:hypothetical protein